MVFSSFGARVAAMVIGATACLFSGLACGGGGGGGSVGGSNRGTLDVYMADAPPDSSITSVEVDISRIEAFVGSNWQVVSSGPQSYDLLDLTENAARVASASLPVGNYTQLRFIVTQARVTDSGGTHIATVPNATTTLSVDHSIQAGLTTSLLLDFNVDRSLVKVGPGNYVLNPVVPAVIRTEAGTITGVATDGVGALSNVKVWAVYTSGGNYSQNWPVNMGASRSTGNFKVWALLPGTYRLDLEWTNGSQTKTATVNDVVVIANQNTHIGSVTLN
jgi:hypothetical protein